MGCFSSRAASPASLALEARISRALQEIIKHKESRDDDFQASFTRIILKFPVLRVRPRMEKLRLLLSATVPDLAAGLGCGFSRCAARPRLHLGRL